MAGPSVTGLARRYELFRLFGVPLRVDLSWFVIAALVAWLLSVDVFPARVEGLSPTAYWVMGVLGALGLFASVAAHELAHALVARLYGLVIRGITLFIFGGVAEMEAEPPTPGAELAVAIAGPLASLSLSVACLSVAALSPELGLGSAAASVLYYLALINLLLALFNLVPAFPLDGGRVLRSALWSLQGDLGWATRVTARIGAGFGLFLILLGIWQLLAGGRFLSGLWLILIGLFLRHAANSSARRLLVKSRLEGEPVRRFMDHDPPVVQRAISLADLIEQHVRRSPDRLFAVLDGDRLIGKITGRQALAVPRAEWDRQSVGAAAEPCSEADVVAPDSPALEALAKMHRTRSGQLLVVEDGRLRGSVALSDLLRFLSRSQAPDGAAS